MLTFRPDLDAVLLRASRESTGVDPTWLDSPPAGFRTLDRTVQLPRSADLSAAGNALLSWDLHRRCGLAVAADGAAAPGATVVLGVRLGPAWAVAPCRVVGAVDEPDRVGFTYITLPGHPEHGIEQFMFVRDDAGPRFEVRAVSRPAHWASRLLPLVADRVQRIVTDRYLDAARAIAAETP